MTLFVVDFFKAIVEQLLQLFYKTHACNLLVLFTLNHLPTMKLEYYFKSILKTACIFPYPKTSGPAYFHNLHLHFKTRSYENFRLYYRCYMRGFVQ